MELGEALLAVRRSKELSQKALAKRMGVDFSHVSRVEHGKRVPSLDYLEKFSRATEVPLPLILVATHKGALAGVPSELQASLVALLQSFLRAGGQSVTSGPGSQ